MDSLRISGGRPLSGTVRISGAKNAVLPIMAASLLTDQTCHLQEVPRLLDVVTSFYLLRSLGAEINWNGREMILRTPHLAGVEAPYEFVRRMRASFLVFGPLLARAGRAKVALPGGCAIGTRPVDQHLKGFAALGASIEVSHGVVRAKARRLEGARIYLDVPSVGATENLMMAATLARGTTVIENAACEPEVVDLANFLNAMGARVSGAGTRSIRIEGVKSLKGARHTVIPDRIEAGTYMAAVLAAGGRARLENVIGSHLTAVLAKFREMGATVTDLGGTVVVERDPERPLAAADIRALPYPGFPTDLQPQVAAVLTLARGMSVVTDMVFDSRFTYVEELRRLGAEIRVEGRSAVIHGPAILSGAQVRAHDLRAGAALVVAALAASGETEISGVEHLERGYENLGGKLADLGVRVGSPISLRSEALV
ncbi:MAG: UDP-N-acetylglucosamine 1-carboxyvinyltransferase [Moorellales bacterium]